MSNQFIEIKLQGSQVQLSYCKNQILKVMATETGCTITFVNQSMQPNIETTESYDSLTARLGTDRIE